ncbi:MAG: hypothetical protein HOP31_12970 [Ignavibacteria bacterium]|nr:hypothetical protein [Ignavibacteria bacterium]
MELIKLSVLTALGLVVRIDQTDNLENPLQIKPVDENGFAVFEVVKGKPMGISFLEAPAVGEAPPIVPLFKTELNIAATAEDTFDLDMSLIPGYNDSAELNGAEANGDNNLTLLDENNSAPTNEPSDIIYPEPTKETTQPMPDRPKMGR